MKRGLILPGYACKSWIWKDVKEELNQFYDFKFIDWPTNLIKDFYSLTDYATWVRDEYINSNEQWDFIIGHSMGGAVALNIAAMESVDINKIILVESFISPPQKFFQNLLMENADENLIIMVNEMLKKEQKLYCNEIRDMIRKLDLRDLVIKLKSEIIAVYGDRGSNDSNKVLEELKWDDKIKSKISFNTISNSCHFPMLENSDELFNFIKRVL